jgi:hypothetical protein
MMITRADIEACVTKGVTERPPVAGFKYVAFAVHPPTPGLLCALAIAHPRGRTSVVDLVREDISVADSAALLKRYGISEITGAVTEGGGYDLAHAVAGAISLTREGLHDA